MVKVVLPNSVFLGQVAELLADGHQCSIRTKGISMLPFIHGERDSVVLQKQDSLAVGDIVLANVPGRGYLLHRILDIKGEDLTLMGDGNLVATESCKRSDVVGTAIWIEKRSDEIDRDAIPTDGTALEAFRKADKRHYVDPRSAEELRKARIWLKLKPVRRLILAFYKRLVLPFTDKKK